MKKNLLWVLILALPATAWVITQGVKEGVDKEMMVKSEAETEKVSVSEEPNTMPVQAALPASTSHNYKFEYSQMIEFSQGTEANITIKGLLNICCDHNPAHSMQLAGVKIVITSEGQSKGVDPEWLEYLQQPIYLNHETDDALKSLFITDKADAFIITLQAQLASALQTAGVNNHGQHWTMQERDQTGVYLAKYTRKANTLQKQKDYYVDVTSKNAEDWSLEHSAVFVFDNKRLASVDFDEITKVVNTPFTITSRQTLKLAWKGSSLGKRLKPPKSWRLVSLPVDSELLSMRDSEKSQIIHDRQILKEATFQDLASELTGNPTPKQKAWLLAKFAALIRLDPDQIGEIEALFASGISEDSMHLLLASLSDAGLPRAQALLRKLINDNQIPEYIRHKAISHLGSVKQPSSESLILLDNLIKTGSIADKRNRVALYAAGDAVNNALSSQSAPSDSVISTLINQYKQADGDREQRVLLNALANSGHPDIIAVIQPLLTDKDEALRSGATEALRFIDDKQADQLLQQQLFTDSSAKVRQSALYAASFRRDDFAGDIVKVLEQDTDPAVRMTALGIVARKYQGDPTNLLYANSIENIVNTENDSELKDRAVEVWSSVQNK